MLKVHVWQSFACNNSGGFRLVARFDEPKSAASSAEELAKFFKAHAKQFDAYVAGLDPNGEWDYPGPPTKACVDLGEKYKFKWSADPPTWGDGGEDLVGHEPVTVAEGGTVVVYHGYCNGFPDDITRYLKARGAKVDGEAFDEPSVTVIGRLPKNEKKKKNFIEPLAKIFAQAATTKYLAEWKLHPAWSGKEQCDGYSEQVAFFNDGKTFGFHLPILIEHVASLKKYLAKTGIEDPSIRLCEEGDIEKLKAIASAQCDACKSPLSYVDPRAHDLEAEQLACERCGGMFDLEGVLKKWKKDAKKRAKEGEKAAAAAKKRPKKKTKNRAAKKVAAKKKSAKKKSAKKKSAKKRRR